MVADVPITAILPLFVAFIAAFTKNSRLTAAEAAEIRRMIDEAEEG